MKYDCECCNYCTSSFWNAWHETGGLIGLNQSAELLNIARPNIEGICKRFNISIYSYPKYPSRKFIGIKDYHKLQVSLSIKDAKKCDKLGSCDINNDIMDNSKV